MSRQALKKGISGRKRRGGGGKGKKGKKKEKRVMEEEEEEVLCYLDRVLEEEEEVFEYGDGELDPISPTHKQFKVRQRPDRWMQGTNAHTHTHTHTHRPTCAGLTHTRLEGLAI